MLTDIAHQKKLWKSFLRIKGNLRAKKFRHLPRKPFSFPLKFFINNRQLVWGTAAIKIGWRLNDEKFRWISITFRRNWEHLIDVDFNGYAQPDSMEEKWTDMITDSFHWNPF